MHVCVCVCVCVRVCACVCVRVCVPYVSVYTVLYCMCAMLLCHVTYMHACMICRVSSHWTQKPERPQTFGSRTAGALNAIAQEHWKRWLEAEVDKEADAARQLILEASCDSDMH